jgi:Outer membrane protein beta-barrel domain
MRMTIQKILLALMFFSAGSAYADTTFSLVGTSAASTASMPGGPHLVSPLGFGAGALLGIPLNDWVDMETGALFLSRVSRFVEPELGVAFEGRQSVLQLPLLMRLNLLGGFSVGLGGYANLANQNVEYYSSSYAMPNRGGWRPDDFGLLASAGLSVPLLPACHLLLDARYAYGLGRFQASAAAPTREAQGLVGLQFVL